MTEFEQIKQRLDDLTGLCGDHSCVFGPPKGLGTNGGCRCEVRNPKVQQAIQLMRRLIKLYQTQAPRTDREIFLDHLEEASAEVETWESWERNLLNG